MSHINFDGSDSEICSCPIEGLKECKIKMPQKIHGLWTKIWATLVIY